MYKVLCSKWIPDEVKKSYEDIFEFIAPEETGAVYSQEEFASRLKDAEIVFLVSGPPMRKEAIESAPNLRLIASLGVGLDHIDLSCATEKNIAVVNSPTKVTDPTAEHTVALIMAAMHNIAGYNRDMRKGKWQAYPFGDTQTSLNGSVLGIVGMGRIGKAVAKKAGALGMKIYYCDIVPLSPEVEAEYGATLCTFDELLKISDCITVHVPMNPENYHLFDEASFAMMKDGAYFVNAARGKIVDNDALIAAVRSGKLKGAALDVFDPEPYLEGELLHLDNVTVTPHVASETLTARIAMAKESLDGAAAICRGEKPYNLANPESLVD